MPSNRQAFAVLARFLDEDLIRKEEEPVCGRVLLTDRAKAEKLLAWDRVATVDVTAGQARPGNTIPMLVHGRKEKILTSAHWGWAGPEFYNVRLETALEKGLWAQAFERRQFCVVPVDAFWEKKKQFVDYYQEPLLLAGLYEVYQVNRVWKRNVALFTVPAEGIVATVATRMPLLLSNVGVNALFQRTAPWDCRDLHLALAIQSAA